MRPGEGMAVERDVEALESPLKEVIEGIEKVRKPILEKATRGEWASVLKILKEDLEFRQNDPAQTTPINKSGDTLLHWAASEGQTDVVKELLSLLGHNEKLHKLGNATSNTPLHLAAARGHISTCKCIVEGSSVELLKARNFHGETPIFVAVLSGKEEVFSALISLGEEQLLQDKTWARRDDGDTILHCAIAGEYFDLASSIIDKFKYLIDLRNARGETPLHLLANNPSAFKSGCKLGMLDGFIYPRIKTQFSEQVEEVSSPKLPKNYFLCLTFLDLLKRCFAGLVEMCMCEKQTEQHAKLSVNGSVWGVFYSILVRWLLIPAKFGLSKRIRKLKKKKVKHGWAGRVKTELIDNVQQWWEFSESSSGMDPFKYRMEKKSLNNPNDPPLQPKDHLDLHDIETRPQPLVPEIPRTDLQPPMSTSSEEVKKDSSKVNIESPFLIAAKNGVIEIVEGILDKFPMAIHDMDVQHKNIMLLAAENRQPDIYMHMLKRKTESWFERVDDEGNGVLHLAAKLQQNQPLQIPGSALLMQREIQWFKFVKEKMPPHSSKRQNHKGQTAIEIFTKTHQELANERKKWLSNTAESCSVVATLITTVAFATTAAVPGGLMENNGSPVFQGKPPFHIFTISSIAALCFSAASLILFLGILTSPYQELDFGNQLPKKLIYGLASLFISIASMFVSFFSGYFFVLDSSIKNVIYPIFIVTSCVALKGFPLYFEFIKQTMAPIPVRTYPNKLSF